MTTRIENKDQITIVGISTPRLDFQSIQAFKADMSGQLLPSCRVVVDLQSVRFIDSTGLGALLSLQRNIDELNGKMAIANAGPQVSNAFRLIKIHRVFDIFATTQDALDAFDN